MADRSSAPKGALITGLVLILLAFGGCGYGCASFVGFGAQIADAVSERNTHQLGTESTYTATGSNAVILTTTPAATCSVNGGDVPLEAPPAGTDASVDLGRGTFELRYVFDATPGRDYRVFCSTELSGSGEYAVADFDLSRIVVGLGGIAAGGLLMVIGAILVIVGLVRRSKWKKAQNNGYGPPPGVGYSPPGGYGAPPPGAPGSPSAPAGPPGFGAPPAPGAPPPPGFTQPHGTPPGPSAPPPPSAPPHSAPPPSPHAPGSPPPSPPPAPPA